MPKLISPETMHLIEQMTRQFKPTNVIAAEVGLNPMTVGLLQSQIFGMKRPGLHLAKVYSVRRFKEGARFAQIAAELGVTEMTVRNHIKGSTL